MPCYSVMVSLLIDEFCIMWWRSVIFSGLIFGVILALIPHIVWLISLIISKVANFKVTYSPFGLTALGLVVVLWGFIAYGSMVGVWQFEVKTHQYSSPQVPKAFKGYKIVHISDLHVDTYNSHPEALARIVDSINAQNADLILFTGDMVTGSLSSVFEHTQALSRLRARDGIMSVLGNHDFFIYDRQYNTLPQRLAAADSLTRFETTQLGWQVLRNAHHIIHREGDSICIAGVDNINGGKGFRTIQMGDLSKALAGITDKSESTSPFTILLTHDPSHWRSEVLPESSVQITLSGHTHAAQLRFFGQSLARLLFNECDGRYDEGERMLYVTAGIGCTAPVRIGCPSEITVITLE